MKMSGNNHSGSHRKCDTKKYRKRCKKQLANREGKKGKAIKRDAARIQANAPPVCPRYKHPSRGARVLAFILQPLKIMVRQCGWCNRLLGFKKNGTGVSTGMCEACAVKGGEIKSGISI